MTRLGFQYSPPVFFLEWLPDPFAPDAYYLRIVDLTPSQIECFKPQGPALIVCILPISLEEQLEAKPWLSSNAGSMADSAGVPG